MSCTIRGEFPIYFAHYPLQGKKLQLAAIYFLNLKTKHIAAVISFLCICPLKDYASIFPFEDSVSSMFRMEDYQRYQTVL
jgi:hypothetical protein